MRDMINVAFQRAWFGPFSIPQRTAHKCKKIIGPMGHPVYEDPKCYEHAGPVYDVGPFDGLMTTSIWAQQMAQIPVVNYAQARPRMEGPELAGAGGSCPIGTRPVTNPDGSVTCKEWHPPSGMMGDLGAAPCPPGTRAVPNPDGSVTCKEWHPPAGMLGPNPLETENRQMPPNQISYPVRSFFGWEKRGM